MLEELRVLDRPPGIDRVLRPMRLFNTPRAGAQLRLYGIGTICAVLLAAAPTRVSGQPGHAGAASKRDATATRAAPDLQRVAMARALFEDGLRQVDAEQWALAADRFARVLSLRYSAVAAYNLALARARLGSSVLALEGLRDLLAQSGLEANVRDAAIALQKEQHAYVGWLTVQVHGACSGCAVQLDGKPLPTAALGVAVPVDPGHHRLVLARAAERLASTSLTVTRGARVEGNLRAPDATLPARAAGAQHAGAAAPSGEGLEPAPAAALEASSDKQPKASLLASPWFWGGVGVLAVGVVTLGIVLAGDNGHAAEPVPGNFSPGVISGEVLP